MKWGTILIGLLGYALVVGGVAWMHQPVGMIVAGVLLLAAFLNLRRVDHVVRKVK